MLAADGRVRVLDFGLSRAYAVEEELPPGRGGGALDLNVTAAGSLLGTPAYMSPEQHARKEANARSDQFSFCVAVWEALYGQRPYAGKSMFELTGSMRRGKLAEPPAAARVPTWVRRHLERGLAIDPELRWPTMDALLAALSHDPRRARRRWLIAGAVAVLVAGVGYAVAAVRSAEAQVCSGAAEELIGVWDADRRAAVAEALRATGVAYAERSLATSVAHLDTYAEKWVAVHTGSCTAHRRGHVSPQLFDRRMGCLRQRQRELAATTEVLAQTTRETVAQAIDTVRGLPAVALCEDDERLQAAVAPPEDPAQAVAVEEARGRLARLEALERSGRYVEALTEVPSVVEEAERLGYVAYRAEVALLAGKLLMHNVRAEARQHFDEALQLGLAAKADAQAAEALALQVFQVGLVERRPQEALMLVPLAWGLLRRLGDPPHLVALLHNNVAAVWDTLGEHRRAIAEYEESLALLIAPGPEDPLRWAVVNNLALSLNLIGEYARTRTLVGEALPIVEAQYDLCYPSAVGLRSVLAIAEAATGEVERAIGGHVAALACYERDFPAYAMDVLHDLGYLHLQRGDEGQTQAQIDRAEALMREHPNMRIHGQTIEMLRVDLELRRGGLDAARRSLEARSAAIEATQGAHSASLVAIETRRGLIAHREHDDERALGHLQRAEALIRPGLPHRERGLFAFTLARVLRGLGRAPERVGALVVEAIAAYTTAGALYAAEVAEIRAWAAGGP